MLVDVVFLPQLLAPRHLANRAVVVLDVLRATTTMAAAIDAGAREVRVFVSVDEARRARSSQPGDALLTCGEERCLRPAGFDLGNSPAEFTPQRVAGRTLLMSTTNGTRAIVSARAAPQLFAAALVNARATARHLAELGADVTLVCAGTDGEVAMEDVMGAGAIVEGLNRLTPTKLASDFARIAWQLFAASENSMAQALRTTLGGRNVVAAGLGRDVDFAARLDAFNHVLTIDPSTLIVTRASDV